MNPLRSLLLLAALSAVPAPAAMIHYDDRAGADTMMTQPLDATLSSGAVPAWWWRLTPMTASRREE